MCKEREQAVWRAGEHASNKLVRQCDAVLAAHMLGGSYVAASMSSCFRCPGCRLLFILLTLVIVRLLASTSARKPAHNTRKTQGGPWRNASPSYFSEKQAARQRAGNQKSLERKDPVSAHCIH